MAYGALLGAWAAGSLLGIDGRGALGTALGWATGAFGLATAAYTGWLFAQAKGRVLWMKRWYWLQLAFDALMAGSAFLLITNAVLGFSDYATGRLTSVFVVSLAVHLAFSWFEDKLAPLGREAEYHRASRLVTHGPYATKHWRLGILVGGILPLVLLLFPGTTVLAAVCALYGLWIEEDIFVRAGQSLPIS